MNKRCIIEHMRHSILAVYLFAVFFFNGPLPCAPETSVIMNIEEARESIVSVNAETYGIFKTGERAVRDNASGRMGVIRGLKTARYDRHGAGAVMDSSGIIVTNAHIVSNASRVTISTQEMETFPAEVLMVYKDEDVAFLKAQLPENKELTPIKIADSEMLRLNSKVFNIGVSDAIKGTISQGTVTGLGRLKGTADQIGTDNDLIQTSFSVYKGDSGGPVLDENGGLVGMISAANVHASKTTYAVPISRIMSYYGNVLQSRLKP